MKKILILSFALLFCCTIAAGAADNTDNPTISASSSQLNAQSPNFVPSVEQEKAAPEQTPLATSALQDRAPKAEEAQQPQVAEDGAVTVDSPFKPEHPMPAKIPGTLVPVDPNMILQGGEDFATATVIPSLPYSDGGTTSGYGHNYTMTCFSNVSSPDVVYSFTPAANAIVNVGLCGSSYDTGLGIFEDNSSTQIGCNDDACGGTVQSQIDGISMTVGHTYYIVVSGWNNNSGAYTLSVAEYVPPICNPDVVVSLPAQSPYSNTNTTCGMINDFTGTCLGSYDEGEDIIYQIDVTADGCYNFLMDPLGTTYTGIAIDENCPPMGSGCVAFATNSAATPYGMYGVSLTVGTYYLMVDTWPAPDCIPSFTLTIQPCPPAPANDLCTAAQPIVGPYPVTVAGTTIGATVDCPGILNWNAVWYTIDLPFASNNLTIDFCPTEIVAIPTIGRVYYNDCFDCNAYVLLDYSWPTCGSGLVEPLLSLNQIAGPATIYFPAYVGSQMDFGFTVDVIEFVPPSADFQVTAPGQWTNGNTCGAVDNCALRVAEDQIWEVTIPTAGTWVFSLCNTSPQWDSYIYLGTGPCMSDLGFNDDFCLSFGNGQITAPIATPGLYYLTVEGYSSTDCGAYTVDVYEAPPPPPNDNCGSVTPQLLTPGTPLQFTGTSAWSTNDCGLLSAPQVWEAFTINDCATVTIDFCGSDPLFSTVQTVLTQCACATLVYSSSANFTDCADGNATIIWGALPAGTYYYPVYGSPGGPYVLNISAAACPPPPTNDDCANAIAIGDVIDLPFSTIGTTYDNTGICQTTGNIWYVYTATCNGNATVDLCGSFYDTKLAAYDGAACSPLGAELACNDDACGLQSRISFPVVTGNQYLIEVGGFSTAMGIGDISVSCAVPPPNDLCSAVTPVPLFAGTPLQFTGTNVGAGNDCPLLGYPQVWEAIEIFECMDIVVDYCGTTPAYGNLQIVMAQECPCGTLVFNSGYDFTTCPDGNGTIRYNGVQPGIYYIPILNDPANNANGPYVLNVSGVACPPPIMPCLDSYLSNGDPDWVNGLYSERRDNSVPPVDGYVSDDFTTTEEVIIDSVKWRAVSPIDVVFEGTGDFQILANDGAGGIPGTVLFEGIGVPCVRTATGFMYFSRDEYIYQFDNLGITLPAGTYWIALRSINTGTTGQTYWGTAPMNNMEAYFKSNYFGFPDWTPSSTVFGAAYDVNFCFFAHTQGGGECVYIRGDINNNGAANGIDVVFGVNYFKGGNIPPVRCDMCPQPPPFYAAGDVNGNCAFNGIDITFFVNYLKGVQPALLNCPTCPPAGGARPAVAPIKVNVESTQQ